MSYPPPPGLGKLSSPQPPSSLPPRPPPPVSGPPSFKPAFSFNNGAGGGAGAYGAPQGFRPRQIGAGTQDWRTASPTVSAPPAPPRGFSPNQTIYTGGNYQAPVQPQTALYPQPSPQEYTNSPAPQIRNPFPLPATQDSSAYGRGQYDNSSADPEYEAQIAQWQSAYSGKDDPSKTNPRPGVRFGTANGEGPASASGANAGPLGGRTDEAMSSSAITSAANADSGVAAVVSGADGKRKTVVRSGGGKTWSDPSLLEWDPAHFRLFVGNLAGEVTDDSLFKAFSKYPSCQKARVVRDKTSSKSRGYGFVSFSDGEEYFQAARDMQGKYIGSHPVLLRKSTTEIRPVAPTHNKRGKFGKNGKGKGTQADTGAGVHKKQSKTKGGLKVLG